MRAKALILEDDREIADLISLYLRRAENRRNTPP
jgi:hypothetical protein